MNVENIDKFPDTAYIFDVDGVLTDTQAKRVEKQELFDELIKRLHSGFPIGINTGRSLDFIIKEVLEPLELRVKDKKLLQDLIAIGEKGAAWITYDVKGKRTEKIDENIIVPQIIQSEVKSLIVNTQYSGLMFYDDSKHTMVSIEELPESERRGTHEDFKTAQLCLNSDLVKLISKHNFQNELKIDPTRIATDIENKHVGKALGARKFVEIFKDRGIKPKKYIGFGDSISDYEMYEELKRIGKNVQFVFVGGREHLPRNNVDGVIFTKQHVDRGTLEYLQGETF